MEHRLGIILQKCKTANQLKQIHLQILINGLKHSNFLAVKLMPLSSDLISFDHALKLFNDLPTPNLIFHNTLIKCSIGKSHKIAAVAFNRLRESDILANSFTFTFLLSCFASFQKLRCGETVHGHVLKIGYSCSVFVMNNLLDFYSKCAADLGVVVKVFDEMSERDVVSWNTMIRAYMSCGEVACAMRLFEAMPEKNLVSWNTVVSGLVKGGRMELADEVFLRMPERNSVSWNTMISGYIKLGELGRARELFDQMPERSVASWTTMVSGYATNGDIASARMVFDQMPSKNVISWNAMIAGCVSNSAFDEALSVFQEMLVDGRCMPNQTTLISILSACTHSNSLEHGRWIESYMRKNKFELSLPLGNALIDMFAKCGDLESAEIIFHKMPRRCIITWTTMISGLAVNGRCREALDLFDTMCAEGQEPDDVIFIAVLSACTHGGLLEEGKALFNRMVQDFGIEARIEHYGCMVDVLARAGKIEEAIRFTESMHLEANSVIWATLLSACKLHGNRDLMELLNTKILEQEPNNANYLKLITDLSSSAGQWQEASIFRVAAREQGREKVTGCSSIHVGESVHEFVAKDTSHPQRKEVYKALRSLNRQMKPLFGVNVDSTLSC
ncbi:pentatricopeptide repeat-containing protein At3g29230-like [Salvia splendens]|nr:pentatricopeptide repeat-containing protein At3g29230-like [Salvia splendens]